MLIFDMTFFLAGWLVGQLLFAGYEAHVPWTKRLSKLLVLTLIFLLLHIFVGRWAFYTLLIGMSAGMAVLEERTLREQLQGYASYMTEVKYRLIPYSW